MITLDLDDVVGSRPLPVVCSFGRDRGVSVLPWRGGLKIPFTLPGEVAPAMGCAGSKDVAPAAGPPAGAAAAAAGSATGADKADIIAAAKAAPKAEGKLILATMGCCAFSARVMIALEHKGLAFDVEVIPSDKDKQPDWFVKVRAQCWWSRTRSFAPRIAA